jgi:diaminopimelate decarboxylase
MGFRVTPEEQAMVQRRMAQTGITNLRAYLLKMAVDGQVVTINLDSVDEMNKLLRSVSNNVNQVAHRANATGNVYEVDLADIKGTQSKIWERQSVILDKLNKIVVVI